MAMLHGKGGGITWGGGATANAIPAEVTSWTVDATADTAEATSMADTWKIFLGGFKSWTAAIETIWTTDDIQLLADLGNDDSGEYFDLELEMIKDGVQVNGAAILTGTSISVDMNDIIKVSFTFQGSGTLAYATGV